MKKLSELLKCNLDIEINGIKMNSKEVEQGDLFVCTTGVTTDRHDYIEDAIKNGAVAAIVSKEIKCSIPTIKVKDTNKILPLLCAKFYDNPEKKLTIIGVTGTDGKTSVATIIQTLIGKDICGYIGTNGRSCAAFNRETSNTTPDSDKLYKYFREFVDAGCKYVVMEASSEAFYRNRLDTIKFDCAIITNITREHLNIHKSFENYIACKCKLFEQVKKDGISILNSNDKLYKTVLNNCHGKLVTYGKNKSDSIQIKEFKVLPDKTLIKFKYKKEEYNIESPLLGDFNVYNLLAGLACAINLEFDLETLISRIKDIKISGRLELVPNIGQNFSIMIDYAHTPNGITNLLKFIHTLDINKSIVVIGSAGERDFKKRPLMGKTVADNASHVIFTYEDPRSENPEDIIEMMISDIKEYKNYEIIVDRSEAIKKAVNLAETNDMVLILGKGNETYQKLKDKTIYFNDFEEAEKYLKEKISA